MPKTEIDRWKQSPAYLQQVGTLPNALRQTYEALVEEYRFHATVHHMHPFVSYVVLAELVKSGWLRSATTQEEDDG